MSVFPGLESALDAAAHRRFGRRRSRSWGRWVAAPALAVCAAALVVAVLPGEEEPGGRAAGTPPPVTVPAATLTRSTALTTAPVPRTGERIGHADLRAVATEIAARVPYPPGAGESMPWEGTPLSPADMASITDRTTVQFLVEYRAACTWATFWLFAFGEADAPALASATAVLQDRSRTGRRSAPRSRTRSSARPAGTPSRPPRPPATRVRYARYAASNCAEVPTPWNGVIR